MTHDQKLKRIRRVEQAVSNLSKRGFIYAPGGSRGGSDHNGIQNPPSDGLPWTDCSGYALYLMSIAGIKATHPAGWTGTLVTEGEEGESEYFTLYLKEPEQTEGHVIVRLRKRPRWWHRGPRYRWTECGGRDNPKSGDGPTWLRPTRSRVSEFPYHRRFRGL